MRDITKEVYFTSFTVIFRFRQGTKIGGVASLWVKSFPGHIYSRSKQWGKAGRHELDPSSLKGLAGWCGLNSWTYFRSLVGLTGRISEGRQLGNIRNVSHWVIYLFIFMKCFVILPFSSFSAQLKSTFNTYIYALRDSDLCVET